MQFFGIFIVSCELFRLWTCLQSVLDHLICTLSLKWYSESSLHVYHLFLAPSGNASFIREVGKEAEGQGRNNVAFLSHFLTGNLKECLELLIKTNRIPEAAFFARWGTERPEFLVTRLLDFSLGSHLSPFLLFALIFTMWCIHSTMENIPSLTLHAVYVPTLCHHILFYLY